MTKNLIKISINKEETKEFYDKTINIMNNYIKYLNLIN